MIEMGVRRGSADVDVVISGTRLRSVSMVEVPDFMLSDVLGNCSGFGRFAVSEYCSGFVMGAFIQNSSGGGVDQHRGSFNLAL